MQKFSSKILGWYQENKRELPWRSDPSPYNVLISEIMLQQTQVPRVIEKYKEFLSLFPTIKDLANATKPQVIQSWSGLGYNRRALLLHKFAKEVVNNHNATIPQTANELIKLPGIGPYTAGAISSFAFNNPDPAIDVNIRRIYTRYFQGIDQGLPMKKQQENELYDLAKQTIPRNKSRDFHNALMDFGSMQCTRNKPRCQECPLNIRCKFYPLYKQNPQKTLFVMEKKKEKGIEENGKHVPNRIFRGRIVEFVRKNKESTTIQQLGENIKKDYTKENEQWLLQLLEKLQKDELIIYTIKNKQITLKLAH